MGRGRGSGRELNIPFPPGLQRYNNIRRKEMRLWKKLQRESVRLHYKRRRKESLSLCFPPLECYSPQNSLPCHRTLVCFSIRCHKMLGHFSFYFFYYILASVRFSAVERFYLCLNVLALAPV